MEKHWIIKSPSEEKKIRHLQDTLGIDYSLANLLIHRGVNDYESAKIFFRPSLDHLHDPFMMKDMDKAIQRIHQAIQHKEKILVYGDYDVDGTTAVAMVYSFLKQITGSELVHFYIPDRYQEGYGLSYAGVDYAKEHGYSLVITLDCGIKANEKVSYGKDIDFIICDHHLPGEELPDAVAVLDPKRKDCAYPYKELSGCGVGFKMIQAYLAKQNMDPQMAHQYLDLVAVSIAADIVPITGENRALEALGLQRLMENPSTGLQSLKKVGGIENKTLDVSDIVFKIGPRINAAGRMESGSTAVTLLTSDSPEVSDEIAAKINEHNSDRKSTDQQITSEALQMLENDPEEKSAYASILYKEDWHKGVIGIVASRLIESYYRPTIVLTLSNGMATGSARSIEGFDLYSALDACSDLLERFGGHRFAAGLTLDPANIPAFKKRFNEYVRLHISESMMKPILAIDDELQLNQITPKFYRILKQFSPFGPENMAPLFCSRNLTDKGTAKLVGTDQSHMKLSVSNCEDIDKPINAIAFSMSRHYEKIKNGQRFDMVYSIEENHFRGQTTLQLNIKDIKFPDTN